MYSKGLSLTKKEKIEFSAEALIDESRSSWGREIGLKDVT